MGRTPLAYALPLFLTASLVGALALAAFHRRRQFPVGATFAWLLAAMAEWALAAGLGYLVPTFELKVLAAKLEYVGVSAIPALWLAMSLRYTHRGHWLTRRNIVIVAIPGAVTLALALTNEWHGLIWLSLTMTPGFPGLTVAARGVASWAFVVVGYVLVLAGVALYVVEYARTGRLYRRQIGVMLGASLIPLVGNAVYVSGALDVRSADLTPYAFAISGVLMALGAFRFRLLRLAPIAAQTVVDNLGAPVLALDARGRIVELNRAARQTLGLSDDTIGQRALDLLRAPRLRLRRFRSLGRGRAEGQIHTAEGWRWFEMHTAPLRAERRRFVGRVVVLHDTTRERELLAAESRRTRQMELLAGIARGLVGVLVPQALMDDAVRSLQRDFGFDHVALTLRDGDELVARAVAGRFSLHDFPLPRVRLGQGIVGWVAQTGQAYMTNDVETDRHYLSVAGLNTGSELTVPLRLAGEVIGVLNVESERAGAFDPSDLRTLESVADLLATGLQSSRWFDELRRRAEELRLLFEAARDFTAGLDESAVLAAVARHLTGALRVAGCAVSRYDPAHDRLTTLAGYDVARGAFLTHGASHSLADYPATRQVLETGQPLRVHADDPQADPAERGLLRDLGYAELLMFPLVAGEAVFGLVELFRRPADPAFSDHDWQLAQGLVAQAATALENARLHAEVRLLAITDPLTGLYNRRHFLELARHEFERARRLRTPLTALMVDLDRFKSINDTRGHAAGDRALTEAGRALAASLRAADLLGRYGGDEFVVLLTDCGPAEALQIVDRIRVRVEALRLPVESGEIGLGLSVGLASVIPAEGDDLESLLACADAEMYRSRAAHQSPDSLQG